VLLEVGLAVAGLVLVRQVEVDALEDQLTDLQQLDFEGAQKGLVNGVGADPVDDRFGKEEQRRDLQG